MGVSSFYLLILLNKKGEYFLDGWNQWRKGNQWFSVQTSFCLTTPELHSPMQRQHFEAAIDGIESREVKFLFEDQYHLRTK